MKCFHVLDELGCLAEPLAIAHFTYKVLALSTATTTSAMLADACSTAFSASALFSPMETEAGANALSALPLLFSMLAQAASTASDAISLSFAMRTQSRATASDAVFLPLAMFAFLVDLLLHPHVCLQVLIGPYVFL